MREAIVNFRIDSSLDRSRSLKRPSDGESSGSSQRQKVEGHTSGGLGSGPAGRDHLRFTDKTREAYHQASPSEQLKPRDQVEQTQTTLGEDLYILEQRNYEMYQNIQAMKKKYQAGPHDLEKLPLPHNQCIDHSKNEIDYNKLTYFLIPEEYENLLTGLNNTHRTSKENLAVKILNTVVTMKQQFYSDSYIRKVLSNIHKQNRYKEIYGNEGEKCRSDQEPSKRTWTTQQLHQLVDEMVQIKDFDHSTFQNTLSEESKAICEQLKYGRSFNDQEWEDIKTRFQNHNLLDNDKRRKYLRYRTENSRNLQKMRENRADSKSQKEGFTNRHRKQRLNKASEPS